MKERQRLDQALVVRGLVESREKAQALILAGQVTVNGQRADKAGKPISSEDIVATVLGNRDVARSADKLRQAFESFSLSALGEQALDIGSSTGGFTQVLLEQGAAHVLAVDVGKGLMHERLARDPKVTLLEETNARSLDPSPVLTSRTICAIDVSFISLRLILPSVWRVCPHLKWIAALVKPQFEVGREAVGKGGIVRDQQAVSDMLETIQMFSQEHGWVTKGLLPCRTKGTKGNQEYLWWLCPGEIELP